MYYDVQVKKAVILASGYGRRMRQKERFPSKPMTLVCRKPLVSYIIDLLIYSGIEKIYIVYHSVTSDVLNLLEYSASYENSFREQLIKEEINNSYGNTNIDRARAVIDGSSIICIFGMSIGATDKMWWQYIAKWLQNDTNRRLVIFAKDQKYEIGKYTNKFKRSMKERFKNNGEVADVLWKQIEGQIYVEVNADIFSFGLV